MQKQDGSKLLLAARSARVALILALTRSRKASSSGVGKYTAVSSPALCGLAKERLSLLSFIKRLPLCFGIFEGATTTQSMLLMVK